MHIIKIVLGVFGSFVAFIVALRLLGIFVFLVAIAVKLIWFAIIAGILTLIVWGIYKLFSPSRAEQL